MGTISLTKHATFRTLLQTYRPVKPTNSGQQPLKSAIKLHAFQDQSLQSSEKQTFQHQSVQPTQKQPFQGHPAQSVPISQDHVITADFCDIVAIKSIPKVI